MSITNHNNLLIIPLICALSLGCAGSARYGQPSSSEDRNTTPVSLASFRQTGMASYYGRGFDGRTTANGERFNMRDMTAAHLTLPFNTRIKVTNLSNNRSVVVRINDRGPYKKNRIIDLSYAAAERIGLIGPGTAKVELEVVKP